MSCKGGLLCNGNITITVTESNYNAIWKRKNALLDWAIATTTSSLKASFTSSKVIPYHHLCVLALWDPYIPQLCPEKSAYKPEIPRKFQRNMSSKEGCVHIYKKFKESLLTSITIVSISHISISSTEE